MKFLDAQYCVVVQLPAKRWTARERGKKWCGVQGWERDEDATEFTNPLSCTFAWQHSRKKWFIVFVNWSVCVSSPLVLPFYCWLSLLPAFCFDEMPHSTHNFPKKWVHHAGWQRQEKSMRKHFHFCVITKNSNWNITGKGDKNITKARKIFTASRKNQRWIFPKIVSQSSMENQNK